MDEVEDTLNADYDLSAWEVPPPAAGLADAVVRRARDPVAHAVVTPRSPRPWIIGAVALAALVAILALVMWGIERAPSDGGGVIAATGPRTLDLGRSSAAIDSGAQLTWTRRGSEVAVAQSRGGATWRVSAEDRLIIDATVASIEASGASLRVEVEMNRSDVRAMGVGSAAAVVVSLVTVIVYEGHVKATSNGQTVNIQPGAAMQFGQEPPPPPPDQLAVGGTPEDQARIKELESEVARLRLELAARDKKDSPKDPPKDKTASCDEVSCVLGNYEGACCDKYKKPQVTCDADALSRKGDDALGAGMASTALAHFEESLACKADPAIVKRAYLAACQMKAATKARSYFKKIPAAQRSNYKQICLRYGVSLDGDDAVPPACDATALKKKGDDYLGNGMDIAALAQFEASLKCKYDSGVVKTAFLAACRSKQSAKAKVYFQKLPAAMQPNYAQICRRFGIELEVDVDASTTPPGTGSLRIASTPSAKIQIDGVPSGSTPLSTQLPAGKHKVTFIVGANKYAYTVTVKEGETTSLSKDFDLE